MRNKKEKKLSDKIFNVLLVIALIGLVIVILSSPMANFSMGDNKLRQDNEAVKKRGEAPVPSELKWHDSFKGISNEGNKEDKESVNFMK